MAESVQQRNERRQRSRERQAHVAALSLADAEAQFDCVMGELRAMRDRFVQVGDAESLEILAQNLQSETF